ncbi:MAG: peptidylprolyl isomerase [Myxococcota bacterium]
MIKYVIDMKKSRAIKSAFFMVGMALLDCLGCATASVVNHASAVAADLRTAKHGGEAGFTPLSPTKGDGKLVNYIAARVQFSQDNDVEIILWDQLQQRARLTGKTWQEARKNWIDEFLMQGFLSKYGQQVTDQDVQISVNRIRQQSGLSDEEFAQALRRVKGFTPKQHRAWVKRQMIRVRYAHHVSSQSRVSDLQLAGALRLRSLLIPAQQDTGDMQGAQAQAQDLVDKVSSIRELDKKTQRFQELAQQLCLQEPRALLSNSQKVNPAHLLKEFEQAVSGASAGSVVGPLYSKGSWHVLLVEERCPVAGSGEWSVGDEQKEVGFVMERALTKLRRTAFVREYDAS